MTDVRLTATNPEDSSAVPVACNSRGELLITDPVIERIPNSLTVEGIFKTSDPNNAESSITLSTTGFATFTRYQEADDADWVKIAQQSNAIAVKPFDSNARFKVYWDGTMESANVRLLLEPDNPDHYISRTKDGESVTEYSGPVIDLVEELQFLRAQVQALMERLKMTPEGGWPVWDGSE